MEYAHIHEHMEGEEAVSVFKYFSSQNSKFILENLENAEKYKRGKKKKPTKPHLYLI